MLTILTNWFADPRNWGTLLITAPIAIFALIVAVKNYKRKSGIAISGGYGIASSSECEESYVSSLVLENLKDRSVTIYGIFLKVGHNFYIELENHDEKPLILKPYETYHKTMGEILFYSVNTNKIMMEKLLNDKKAKKRLVLSTSEGKYIVPKQVKHWSPLTEFFKNHLTGIIRPVRVTHNNKDIGGNVRFIVDITNKDGHIETIKLMKSDYQLAIFKNFSLTEECLLSKDSLESFLEEMLEQNLISKGSTIKVYDFEEHKNKISEIYRSPTIEPERWSASYYYIFGRIYTWYSNLKMVKANRRNQKNT
ncbi:hypothetical protein [Pseudomonas chlororaphis]|uniref:hypothetical protein n=1 Tax=Pseudomonas chlororaphis TaxID=587753 RepID=UPI0024082C20|nr:hypothetical protein [Pseudomonas chlororaphis]